MLYNVVGKLGIPETMVQLTELTAVETESQMKVLGKFPKCFQANPAQNKEVACHYAL